MGKGDGRRPRAISAEEERERWERTFGGKRLDLDGDVRVRVDVAKVTDRNGEWYETWINGVRQPAEPDAKP